jgi:hypothetical protein
LEFGIQNKGGKFTFGIYNLDLRLSWQRLRIASAHAEHWALLALTLPVSHAAKAKAYEWPQQVEPWP